MHVRVDLPIIYITTVTFLSSIPQQWPFISLLPQHWPSYHRYCQRDLPIIDSIKITYPSSMPHQRPHYHRYCRRDFSIFDTTTMAFPSSMSQQWPSYHRCHNSDPHIIDTANVSFLSSMPQVTSISSIPQQWPQRDLPIIDGLPTTDTALVPFLCFAVPRAVKSH